MEQPFCLALPGQEEAPHCDPRSEERQGKAGQKRGREGKARQGKRGEGEGKQGKAGQGEVRGGKVGQCKARQSKARDMLLPCQPSSRYPPIHGADGEPHTLTLSGLHSGHLQGYCQKESELILLAGIHSVLCSS